jgi:hypothetical protein
MVFKKVLGALVLKGVSLCLPLLANQTIKTNFEIWGLVCRFSK